MSEQAATNESLSFDCCILFFSFFFLHAGCVACWGGGVAAILQESDCTGWLTSFRSFFLCGGPFDKGESFRVKSLEFLEVFISKT